MSIRDLNVTLPGGEIRRFGDIAPGAVLVVNVASKCGFTPQYEGLEALSEKYGPRGLTVIGMPCNQFLRQEPGGDAQIAEFCQLNYGVSFPLLAKGKVNGRGREPLFDELRRAKDASGSAGVVRWNFEKFVVWPEPTDGGASRVKRFRSTTEPESAEMIAEIEAALAAS
jgi:glutathione peroxidase